MVEIFYVFLYSLVFEPCFVMDVVLGRIWSLVPWLPMQDISISTIYIYMVNLS